MTEIRRIITIAFVIVFTSGAAGIIFNVLNPAGIKIIPVQKQQYDKKIIKPLPEPKKEIKSGILTVKTAVQRKSEVPSVISEKDKSAVIENIDLNKAKELFDKAEAIFLDTRPEFRYLEGHIKGALSLSASRFVKQYEEVKDKIKKDSILVTYCSGVECHLSGIVADKLKGLGYTKIKIFDGGWPLWNDSGYPVEKGKNY